MTKGLFFNTNKTKRWDKKGENFETFSIWHWERWDGNFNEKPPDV